MKTVAVVIGCLMLSGASITAAVVAMYYIGAVVIEALRGPPLEPPGEFQ